MRASVPPNWKRSTLGDLTTSTRPICYGVLKPGPNVPGGIPLVRVTDISENRFSDARLIRISPALDEEFRRSRLRGGEILVSIQGTVGRVALCPPEHAGANISRTIAVIEPDDRADRRYAYWYLRHLGDSGAFDTVGSTRASLNIAALRQVEIPLPPLAEQRRIADILDRADALRAKRRAALEQVTALERSMFLEMFGDPVTNSMRWPLKTLKQLGKVVTGGTPPGSEPGMFGGSIPFITPGDLGTGRTPKRTLTEAGARNARTVRKGSALVCCIGATIGKMDEGPEMSACNQQINAVEWGAEVNDEYGLSVLRAFKAQIVDRGASTTLPILKKSAFEQIAVPVPPVELQRQYGQRVGGFGSLATTERRSLTHLNALVAALQHRAFRGQL